VVYAPQAVIAFDATVSGGACLLAATAAVKTSVQTFMAAQTGAGGVNVAAYCQVRAPRMLDPWYKNTKNSGLSNQVCCSTTLCMWQTTPVAQL